MVVRHYISFCRQPGGAGECNHPLSRGGSYLNKSFRAVYERNLAENLVSCHDMVTIQYLREKAPSEPYGES